MKLPMLFKSLFETEPENAAPEARPEPVAEPAPAPQAAPTPEPQFEPVEVEHVRREHDPLLDGIEALGEIVLALDAQLRAERSSSTALRLRLNHELAALRRVLQ
jgi:hypothetical protein